MKSIGKQFHNRPMLYAACGAVFSVVLYPYVPIWFLLALCAFLIPATAFLFHRRNVGFLFTAAVLLMLLRMLLIPDTLSENNIIVVFLKNLRNGMKTSADILFLDEASVAKGIILGDISGIEIDQYGQFLRSGLLHVFAVSGLHVSLLTDTLGKLVRSRNKALSFSLLFFFLLFICAITEFSSSVLRAAFVMIGIRISRMREKQVDMPSIFFFAMAMTLLCKPFSLYETGFQLSFAAAWGMILFAKSFRKPFQNRFPNSMIVSSLTSSAAATIGMLPIMATKFGELAWVSIPLSVILIPTMPVILLFGFFSVLLNGIFPHIASILSYPAYGAIKAVNYVTEQFNMPLLHLPRPHPIVIVAYYIALLLCSKLFLRNAKKSPILGLSLLILTVFLWFLI